VTTTKSVHTFPYFIFFCWTFLWIL